MAKYVLFVCTENSARSQMAEGFFNAHNTDSNYIGMSAGLEPAASVKPMAIKVMAEKGIDISKNRPKMLTPQMVANSERIILMGCIKTCPLTPKEKTEDWELEDPAGKSGEKFREVRDEIEKRVKKLVSSLE